MSRPRARRLAFLGFGNVGRATWALLQARRAALRARYGLAFRVTGVATRRGGWWADASGLDPAQPSGTRCADVADWLARARPDLVLESLPLDPLTGQPALDYARAALRAGAHLVSANKGPVVHGYRELSRLAGTAGRRYLFEAAVMDGAPVFSLVRACLPLADLRGVAGVFTSTATVVLEAIEAGHTVHEGIARARALGVAEENPAFDVDGWDSVVKLCALAAVLFDAPIAPGAVERAGIGALAPHAVRAARADGRPYRLVGRLARRGADLVARVAPEQLSRHDPLAVRGTTLVLRYDADVFPGGLTVTSRDPDNTTTAYGMLADLITALGARPAEPR